VVACGAQTVFGTFAVEWWQGGERLRRASRSR